MGGSSIALSVTHFSLHNVHVKQSFFLNLHVHNPSTVFFLQVRIIDIFVNENQANSPQTL